MGLQATPPTPSLDEWSRRKRTPGKGWHLKEKKGDDEYELEEKNPCSYYLNVAIKTTKYGYQFEEPLRLLDRYTTLKYLVQRDFVPLRPYAKGALANTQPLLTRTRGTRTKPWTDTGYCRKERQRDDRDGKERTSRHRTGRDGVRHLAAPLPHIYNHSRSSTDNSYTRDAFPTDHVRARKRRDGHDEHTHHKACGERSKSPRGPC